MCSGGDLEAVLFGEGGVALVVVGLLESGLILLVEHVAEALQKQQGEDERLVFAGIDGPAEERCCTPKVGLELRLADAGGHAMPRSASTWFRRSSAAQAAPRAFSSAFVASSTDGMSTSSGFDM